LTFLGKYLRYIKRHVCNINNIFYFSNISNFIFLFRNFIFTLIFTTIPRLLQTSLARKFCFKWSVTEIEKKNNRDIDSVLDVARTSFVRVNTRWHA